MDTQPSNRSTLPGLRTARYATRPLITQAALREAMIAKIGSDISLRRFYVIECGRGKVDADMAEVISGILGCTVDALKTGEVEVRGRGRPKDLDPLSRVRRAVESYGKEALLSALDADVKSRTKGAGGTVVRLLRGLDSTVVDRVGTLRAQIESIT